MPFMVEPKRAPVAPRVFRPGSTYALPLVVWSVALSVVLGGEPVFDDDPQHPWNRLHRALYTRTMQDGKTYDPESLEPPFIPSSNFLTAGTSHGQALAVLDEFLKARLDTQNKGPLKRAVLQRDLWAVFAITADPDGPRQAQRRALQKRLAQVMRRIALNAKEIEALPDNLAAAVHAGAFPTAFDPKNPDRYFLPPDLLDRDGPWVVVGNRWRHDVLTNCSDACRIHQRAQRVLDTYPFSGRAQGHGEVLEDATGFHASSSGAAAWDPIGFVAAHDSHRRFGSSPGAADHRKSADSGFPGAKAAGGVRVHAAPTRTVQRAQRRPAAGRSRRDCVLRRTRWPCP
jgi:hypothetical protein